MSVKLHKARESYLQVLDKWARENALMLATGTGVTQRIVKQLDSIYKVARADDGLYRQSESFESAYHTPITGDFEFLLARTLYHRGRELSPPWQVYLRCQVNGATPDIRIRAKNRTIGILEIKAKLGWMQPFFSEDLTYEPGRGQIPQVTQQFEKMIAVLSG